jgi:hypothetical protein
MTSAGKFADLLSAGEDAVVVATYLEFSEQPGRAFVI